MEIVGHDFGLNAEELLVNLHSALKMLQCLQVFQVPDMLAHEGIVIPGQAEGVF